ncbi:MAG: antitoxin, RHH family protein [bacterium]|nr:antitoxin, RHH family protein [bacterium]MDT8396480.1 antitoxin, RHH family protein [bacterium]
MPTKNPRINIVVEGPLYKVLKELADKKGLSLSTLSRDLIREALEMREDIALNYVADKRDRTLKAAELIDHDDAWS